MPSVMRCHNGDQALVCCAPASCVGCGFAVIVTSLIEVFFPFVCFLLAKLENNLSAGCFGINVYQYQTLLFPPWLASKDPEAHAKI
jgi:hypothetical protein